ncbi:hypothetical protein [Paracidovorax oryzae]|uniref:hypothetical protein n=2 Tax=Paracidovorax oryzae TaxID=862720 RepID=UPI000553180E
MVSRLTSASALPSPRARSAPAASSSHLPGGSSTVVAGAGGELRSRGVPTGLPAPRRDMAGDALLRPYVMARAIDGRHVEGPDLARLRQAHGTVEATRRLLSIGRGNVAQDIERTGGESLRGMIAAKAVAGHLVDAGWPQVAANAAGAIAARAGNCDEHAALAALLHVPRLRPQEALCQVISHEIPHVWTEVRGDGGPEDDLVMDAWLEGPAVFAPDGQWSDTPATKEEYFVQGGPEKACLDGLLAHSGAALHAWVEYERSQVPEGSLPPPGYAYPAMPAVSRAFERRIQRKLSGAGEAERAASAGVPREALEALPAMQDARRALRYGVLAVGVARQMTAGLGVRQAVAEVPALLYGAACRLRQRTS